MKAEYFELFSGLGSVRNPGHDAEVPLERDLIPQLAKFTSPQK